VDYPKFIIPGIVLLIGIARFLQGLANDRPVGLLVAEIGIFSLSCFALMQAYSYTRTVREQLRNYWMDENKNGHGTDILNNFSILGTAAITGFAEYTILNSVFSPYAMPPKNSWGSNISGCGSSGGCGSSCGSGCGGGGCGGCGS
jgi:hypothetical protein